MKITAALLLLLCSPAFAQITFVAYQAPSFSVDFTNAPVWAKPLDFIWKESKSAGMAVKVNTSGVFALSVAGEIAEYDFNVYPVFSTPDPWTWRKGTAGDASMVYRFYVDACLPTSARENVQITYSTGVGYIVETMGKLRTTWGRMYGPDVITDTQYPDNRSWVQSFGVGIHWFVAGVLGFDFSTRYCTDYAGTLLITYTSGVVLQLDV